MCRARAWSLRFKGENVEHLHFEDFSERHKHIQLEYYVVCVRITIELLGEYTGWIGILRGNLRKYHEGHGI